MTTPFMRAYTQLLVKTCHRRGVHAMGGMAAHPESSATPRRTSARSRRCARTSCARRATATTARGSRTPLVPVATRGLRRRPRRAAEPARAASATTSTVARGRSPRRARRGRRRTEEGARARTSASGIHYLESWLRGVGCVPHLQPDGRRGDRGDLARAGLAVDARTARLDDGAASRRSSRRRGDTREAGETVSRADRRRASLRARLRSSDDFVEFLTLPAYE